MKHWYNVTAVLAVNELSIQAESAAQAEQIAKEILEAQADQMAVVASVIVTAVVEVQPE